MELIKLTRKNRNPEEWYALAKQWYDSGETQKLFCLRRGIKAKTLSKWAVEHQRKQEVGDIVVKPAWLDKAFLVQHDDCITVRKGSLTIRLPLNVCSKLLDRMLLRLGGFS